MLSPDELADVLKRVGAPQPASFYESDTLEFKQAARTPRETLTILADASVCFANATGGTIVLGVNDKATTRTQSLVGVDPGITTEAVRLGIFERTTPHITPFVTEWDEDGVRLIVVNVPQGAMPHSNSAGRALRRIGAQCRPFTPDQQREVLAARGHVDWSAEPSNVMPKALSQVEFGRMRRLLREGGSPELAGLRDRPLLDALSLVAPNGEVTRAGLLLLGEERDLHEQIPSYGYSYQYRPSAGSEATSRFRESKPLLAGVEDILDAVGRRVEIRPLNLAGGIQLELADYPPSAVREVSINAFIHRSYDAGGSVDVEHTPERLGVMNPGGLVAGVTPENILTHPSTPRHRLLSDAVAKIRLAEKTGQGIDRTYREMLRAGKPPPVFEDTGLVVRAMLPGGVGNDAFVRFVAELPEDLGADVEVLLALSVLRSKTATDARKLATVIQRSAVEAQDVLERLASEEVGVLEATRGTLRRRFPSYRLRSEPFATLARAVSYRRRTADETDAKVVEHIKEYGFVTNKTLQRLFDMNVYTARNLLSDLQRRGLVEKIGSARGGPGVRYGRGEKFPTDA